MKYIQTQKNKGFVILFAILISSLILLISAGIFNIVQKEVVLSSYARESQRAFYAADSALECALFADIFGIGSPNPTTPFSVTTPIDTNFDCGGSTITSDYFLISEGTQGYEYPFVFRYYNSYNVSDNSCAYVLVEKELKGDPDPNDPATETRITAVGFNVCTDTSGEYTGDTNIPNFNDPTLLERRISIIYNR